MKTLIGIVSFSCLLIACAMPASAQEGMGMDGLHDQRRESANWCMSDHFHSGSGTGTTRKAAEHEAIASWQGFTAWEYGDVWSNWRLASSRSMSCTPSGDSWNCAAEARACRPYGRSAPQRKRRGRRISRSAH